MKNGFNNRNDKKVSAGYQNNRTCGENSGFAQCINVDAIYSKLKSVLARLAGLEAQYNKVSKIDDDGTIIVAQLRKLDRITDALGQKTYQVEQLLDELTKYSETHKAMNLAYDYVSREITRIERIVDMFEGYIREIEAGELSLINSHGVSHTNTTNLKNYVAKKRQQLSKLNGWKSHLSRYRVA